MLHTSRLQSNQLLRWTLFYFLFLFFILFYYFFFNSSRISSMQVCNFSRVVINFSSSRSILRSETRDIDRLGYLCNDRFEFLETLFQIGISFFLLHQAKKSFQTLLSVLIRTQLKEGSKHSVQHLVDISPVDTAKKIFFICESWHGFVEQFRIDRIIDLVIDVTIDLTTISFTSKTSHKELAIQAPRFTLRAFLQRRTIEFLSSR